MYARMAKWEGGEADGLRASGEEINSRKGDEALNAMTPQRGDVGARVSVESYEVAVDVRP